MWIVLKFKLGECEILKNSISKVLGCMPEFYNPKIKLQKHVNNKLKIYKKYVLNNYLICRHEKFKNRSLVNSLRNINAPLGGVILNAVTSKNSYGSYYYYYQYYHYYGSNKESYGA